MRKSLVVMVLAMALIGCGTTGEKPTAAQMQQGVDVAVAIAKTALATAQAGYFDYALISGKAVDPKAAQAQQVIDGQLDFLGKAAAGIIQISQAQADESLKKVDTAKAQIAAAK